jgi:hypothetical protein
MSALPTEQRRKVERLIHDGANNSEIERVTGHSRHTVRSIRAAIGVDNPEHGPIILPPGKHEAPAGDGIPAAVDQEYTPFAIDTPGVWLLLMDCHVPYHDRGTIQAAVGEAKRRGAVGVILNGDTLDQHYLSDHDKDPAAPRYVDEVDTAKKLLRWLREQFPRATVVMKEGNHEERLQRYLMKHAPALFGLEGVDVQSFLHLAKIGAEWVGGRRVIALGKLNVIHGHEYQGGAASPVAPARGLYLRARSPAMCGHHHRTNDYHGRNIRGRIESAWTVGCACFLSPFYRRLNDWNNGFALVDVATDGTFAVENRRVIGGKVV